MNLENALSACRARASEYLDTTRVKLDGACYWRFSPAHHPDLNPNHLMYGTWAGVLASVLLGKDRTFGPEMRSQIARGFERFQRPSGFFTMKPEAAVHDMPADVEYLNLHCTNYALGALRALGLPLRLPFPYLDELSSGEQLRSWLARRNWTNPWAEGNNVVNLGSLYALLHENGTEWAGARLRQLIQWHNEHQHPRTGLWHADAGRTRSDVLRVVAGAAHNLHLYYHLGLAVPEFARIIDTCLGLGYLGIRSACIDIDIVDVLVNFRRYRYRVAEIDRVLERYLVELLQVQNKDGGFSDSYVTPHRNHGLTTPARTSVTWITWFRLATIGMIACAFMPEERSRWTFRKTLGMGYYNLGYALPQGQDGERLRHLSQTKPGARLWLAARRAGRFQRQRAVWVARRLLRPHRR